MIRINKRFPEIPLFCAVGQFPYIFVFPSSRTLFLLKPHYKHISLRNTSPFRSLLTDFLICNRETARCQLLKHHWNFWFPKQLLQVPTQPLWSLKRQSLFKAAIWICSPKQVQPLQQFWTSGFRQSSQRNLVSTRYLTQARQIHLDRSTLKETWQQHLWLVPKQQHNQASAPGNILSELIQHYV